MEMLRHIKDRLFPASAEREKTTAQHRAEELDYVREVIQLMYINGQVNLSTLSNDLKALRRASAGLARETVGRISFDSERRAELFSDELIEAGIEQMLSVVNATPQQEEEIRLQALRGAKNYWEDRLIQPDLIPDEIMLGRRRLVRITVRLEELDRNPPPPQNP